MDVRDRFFVIVLDESGNKHGVKMRPFNYTNRYVLGLKEYNKRVEAE